jgi:hypothetical protein
MKPLTVLLLSVILSSCSSARVSPFGSERNTITPEMFVTVEVQNENWNDVNVFLLNGDYRKRLGTVNTAIPRRFIITESMVPYRETIQFVIQPIGNRNNEFTTDSFVLPYGGIISLRVMNNLRMTYIQIF